MTAVALDEVAPISAPISDKVTLELSHVEKTYPNGHYAVKGVDIDVRDGELVVFVGPSGCGKSTLLRMVAGLEDISVGTITLNGKVINDTEPAARDIAMVFQNYALYPHMSVRQNLAYGLKNRGVGKEERNKLVEEAAELLQISQYLDRKPQQLSGGQRQRVAMGRAIVRDPALFLFDEPLSNLDAKLRQQMRLEIKKLQRRQGVAAIYVTHDQVEAMTLADRIAVLNEGLVEQFGTPDEIYANPASAFVASFMGSPPMNLIPATGESNTIGVADGKWPFGRSLPSGNVTLGVRPERLKLQTAASDWSLPTRIDFIEELGAGRLAHGTIGGTSVIAALDIDERLDPGDYHAVIQDPNRDVHAFDAETGKAL